MELQESNLLTHAKTELQLAGLYDKDSDYGGMIGEAVEDIIKVFAEQGHSGYSASMVTTIVTKLMQFKPLTPITNNPDDWMEVENFGPTPTFQCRRNGSCFSSDGGKTYYDIDERPSRWRRVTNFLLRRKGWDRNPLHTAAND